MIFLIRTLKEHLSLFVMVIGVSLQLMGSVLLYKVLSPDDYAVLGIWLTVIAVVMSFGLFGAEQTLLRYTDTVKDRIRIPVNVIKLLVGCLVIGPVIFSAGFYLYWGVSLWKSYGLVLCSVLLVVFYNLFRLYKEFVLSQFVNNLWRFFFIFPVVFSLFYLVDVNAVYYSIVAGMIFGLVLSVFFGRVKGRIVIGKEKEGVLSLTLSFLFTMGVLTFFNFVDRVVVSGYFSKEEFANYFFLSNVFLSPFSIFSSYLGFKGLVRYKSVFSIDRVRFSAVLSCVAGGFFGCLIVVAALFLDFVFDLGFGFEQNLELIVPMVCLGVVRLVYSGFSAAMGARGSNRSLVFSNLMSLVFILLVFVFYYQIELKSVVIVLWCVCVAWFIRCGLYYFELYKLDAVGDKR